MALSGRFRSSLVIGLQGIRARKMRTLLSMVSLFLGVLAVVVVQAGAELAAAAALADVELREGKDGTVQMFVPSEGAAGTIAMDTLKGRKDAVGVISTGAIIGEPGVTPINPHAAPFDGRGRGPDSDYYCDSSGYCFPGRDPKLAATSPGQAIELGLSGMTGDVRQFRPYRPVSGQWLDFDSAPSLSPRLVLNKEAAKGFGRYRVPAEMRIEGAPVNPTPRIIGVVDDGDEQPRAYVRADELLTWMPTTVANQRNGGLQVLLAPTATEIEQILKSRLVANGVAADHMESRVINSKEQIASQLALMRWVFLGMAGLVLLIGVAGILNVGLATVGERVEEFALRRAVGTPRSLLAGIVLAETLLTGLLTSAAAIGFGVLGLKVLGSVLAGRGPFPQQLDFPWQAGVAGVVAGLIAGLLGGLIPAIRAARVPIATVMRA
ncbi:ABC transporter permease [Longispora sp. NPDC051575]|uniref:ABC transporter permease n=1 Tax=Longispora sp. NPDC051575 TaxID=3154943 RepID=UPI003423B28C